MSSTSSLASLLGTLFQAKKKLNKDREGEFEAELQAFPYPCCAIDSNGHISKWNGSAEKRTGFRQKDVLDAPFDTLVDPDDRAKILSALDEAEFNKLDIDYNEESGERKVGDISRVEVTMRFKDGGSELWMLSLAPLSTLLGDRYIVATYNPPVDDELWLKEEREKLEHMDKPELVEESMQALRENRHLRHQCGRLGAMKAMLSHQLNGALGEVSRMCGTIMAPGSNPDPQDGSKRMGFFGISWRVLIAGMVGMVWGMLFIWFLVVQYDNYHARFRAVEAVTAEAAAVAAEVSSRCSHSTTNT
uniref:PAS domain-containing protein n=1 Tax=Pyramimonas obovata TaxID=1411642 RepID=A0A7S0MUD4_9CHLO|mmetsp:Transcript_11078/g.23107  ORF Transcript_11078/g.23107 Transcript_11078/m.23107 type:complete len:303 (+) Transcript_11078:237-1145(+)